MRISTLLFIFLSAVMPLFAENFSSTRILYHYSDGFNEVAGSDSISDGVLQTLTLEHSSSWNYGSNFFFIDMNSAEYDSGKHYKVYSEWAPALSLSKIFKKDLHISLLKDISISGEINQGEDFQALNYGLRLSLDIPGFTFFNTNFFARKDNYNQATFQLTLAWQSQFTVASVPFVFEGFFDHYGVDFGTETLSQPRLFLDGKMWGMKDLMVGTELYYYRSSESSWRPAINTCVPQLALKWLW